MSSVNTMSAARVATLCLSVLAGSPQTGLCHPAVEPASAVAPRSTLPGSFWVGTTFANGTMVMSRPDGSGEKVVEPSPATVAVVDERDLLSKRLTSCWGTNLDHSGTDAGTAAWRNEANQNGGYELCSGSGGTSWVGYENEDVWIYYCIIARSQYGNIDLVDVNYALSQMDAACPAYTASYFRWDGSVEIFGKVNSGVSICVE